MTETGAVPDHERGRLAALIHDHILWALTMAASGHADAAALSSRTALDELDAIARAERTSKSCTADETVDMLRTVASGSEIVRRVHIDKATAPSLPTATVRTVTAALAQAVRNSLHHAGSRAASRTLDVALHSQRLTVALADDGVGFDPERIPADRLGVRGSIIAPLRRLPGGHAHIESRPGRGTSVTLTWTDSSETRPLRALDSAARARKGERRREADYLGPAVRPILERLARGEKMTRDDRIRCRLLAAQLRDRLRVPRLVTDALAASVRSARARGVDVTLYDDAREDSSSDDIRERAVDAAIALLGTVGEGHVTVRVLPPGRALAATVVAAEPAQYRRIELTQDRRKVVS